MMNKKSKKPFWKRWGKKIRRFWSKKINPKPKASLKVLETIQDEKSTHMTHSLEYLGGIVAKLDKSKQNAAV